MVKEPKKSDSSTKENTKNKRDYTSSTSSYTGTATSHPALSSPSTSRPLKTFIEELEAMIFHGHGYLQFDYFTLFWLFVAGSIIGLGLETLYHAIVFGGFESRAGLVWGPFSPIYGFGALALTLFLNRYYHSHNLVVFLIAMLIGSFLEYVASWGMEVFWGAIAWDYTGTFGNIQGRTNFFFGMMWGMLGLIWVRVVLPLVKKGFEHTNQKNPFTHGITILMSIFIVVNISFTCFALHRAKERADNISAHNPIQMFFDEVFPDEYLNARFENMTVAGTHSIESEKGKPLLLASPF